CRYEMEQGLAQMPVIVGVPHDLRYNSTFGKKIPFELEGEAFELERRISSVVACSHGSDGGGDDLSRPPSRLIGTCCRWSSRCTTLPGTPSRSPIGRTSWDGSWSQNFDVAPQMRSKLWSNIEKGIKQHFTKVYADNKSYLKRTYWSVKPGKMRDVESIRS
ncbi:hypothetical protein Tco_0285924, partial [Tanacetum coccineum]